MKFSKFILSLLLMLVLVACENQVTIGLQKKIASYSVEYVYPTLSLQPGDGSRTEAPIEVKCFGASNVEVDLSKCQLPATLPTKTYESPAGYGPSYTDVNGNTVRDYFGAGSTAVSSSEVLTCSTGKELVGTRCVTPFRFKVDIASAGDYSLSLSSNAGLKAKYNFSIDWGDGTIETISNPTNSYLTHNYAGPAVYTVTVLGTFPAFNGTLPGFPYTDLKKRMTEVVSLGEVEWEDLSAAFKGTDRLNVFNAAGETSNVTKMNQMFYNARELVTLDLSSFDTSKVTDMSWMFYQTSKLTTLNVSSFETNLVNTMEAMFYGTGVTNLNLSNFDTRNVTTMSQMFLTAKSATINISGFDTSNVTSFSSMFTAATSLTSITFPASFKTGVNASMTAMFSGTLSLTSLDLSSFDTSRVSRMVGMFQNMNNITSLNVSSFNTGNVNDMTDMFKGLVLIPSLDVRHFDVSKATKISGMFADCPKITSLDLSNWNTALVSDMSQMFSGMSDLRLLNISGFDFSSLPSLGGGLPFSNTTFSTDAMVEKKLIATNAIFPAHTYANNFFNTLGTNRGIKINVETTTFPLATSFSNSNAAVDLSNGFNFYCGVLPGNLSGVTCLDPAGF